MKATVRASLFAITLRFTARMVPLLLFFSVSFAGDKSSNLPKAALTRIGSSRFQHGDRILDVDVSDHGKLVASISRDQTVRVWDGATGGELLRCPVSWGRSVAIFAKEKGFRLALGTDFGVVRLVSEKGKTVRVMTGHRAPIQRLAFDESGGQLVSVCADGALNCWKIQDGSIRFSQKKLSSNPREVQFASADELVLSMSDHQERIDLKSGVSSVSTEKKRTGPSPLASSRDGQFFVKANAENRIEIYQREKGQLVPRCELRDEPLICQLSWSRYGRCLIQRAGDTIALRSLDESRPQSLFADLKARQMAIANESEILVVGGSKSAIVWDLKSSRALDRIRYPAGLELQRLAVSRDGSRVALGLSNARQTYFRMRLWTRDNPTQLRMMDRCRTKVHSLDFSPDGSCLIGAGANQRLLRWSVKTGRMLESRAGLLDASGVVRYSPNGSMIASTNRDGMITLSDAKTGKIIRHLTAHPGKVQTLEFSPDGRSLASGGGWDSTVLLHDVRTGAVARRLLGHEGPIRSLCFDESGERLISTSTDASILIWDLPGFLTGKNQQVNNRKEFEKTWKRLADRFGEQAWLAEWALVGDGKRNVSCLSEKLRYWMGTSAKRIQERIRQLDHDEFEVRENAAKELADCLHLATPALRRALRGRCSLESRRRIRKLLAKTGAGRDQERKLTRARRAVAILERMARRSEDKSALRLLQSVSRRASDPMLQIDATQALARLSP